MSVREGVNKSGKLSTFWWICILPPSPPLTTLAKLIIFTLWICLSTFADPHPWPLNTFSKIRNNKKSLYLIFFWVFILSYGSYWLFTTKYAQKMTKSTNQCLNFIKQPYLYWSKGGFKKNTSFYPHFVDKRLTPPPSPYPRWQIL